MSWKDQDWNDFPIFMKEVPQDAEQNESLAALQSLVYDIDNPDEKAENFKQMGNDEFRKGVKGFPKALEYYQVALDAKSTQGPLVSQILSNRAAIYLRQKNYGRAIEDCTEAIVRDPNNIKAYFRAAKASHEIKKYKEALQFLKDGLVIDPENKEMKEDFEVNKAKYLQQLDIDNSKKKQEESEKQYHLQVAQEIKKRKIVIGKPLFDFSTYISLSQGLTDQSQSVLTSKTFDSIHRFYPLLTKQPSPDGVEGNEVFLVWSVLFLYPEYRVSDFLQQFHENSRFCDHIDAMFPPNGERASWDVNGFYQAPSLEVYYETNATPHSNSEEDVNWKPKKLRKVSTKAKLLTAITQPDHIIPSAIPVFYVLSKDSPFYSEYFQNRVD